MVATTVAKAGIRHSLQGCRIGHLDRPTIGAWPSAVTSVPARAMGLEGLGVGTLAVGGPADFVLFRGRRYSELLARPQFDRVSMDVTNSGGYTYRTVHTTSKVHAVRLQPQTAARAHTGNTDCSKGSEVACSLDHETAAVPRAAAAAANCCLGGTVAAAQVWRRSTRATMSTTPVIRLAAGGRQGWQGHHSRRAGLQPAGLCATAADTQWHCAQRHRRAASHGPAAGRRGGSGSGGTGSAGGNNQTPYMRLRNLLLCLAQHN